MANDTGQKALDVLSLMVLEDGHRWGETAAKFQWENARAILDLGADVRQHWIELPRGARKPLSLSTPLPTPDGWTTMGDVRPGTRLLSETGEPCTVTYLSPVLTAEDCYRVTFDDGSRLTASGGHEWAAEDNNARMRRNSRGITSAHALPGGVASLPPVTTRQIATSLRNGPRGDLTWSVPCARAWDLPSADLPLPPYVLGAWLGDGTSETAHITVSDDDLGELAARFEADGFPLHHLHCRRPGARCATWRFGNPQGTRTNDRGPAAYDSTRLLRRLGVLKNKHIPAVYLRASAKQRLELLRGLMDTDGYFDNQACFCSTSRVLADNLAELVVSLGWKARQVSRPARLNGIDCGAAHEVRFRPDVSPFSLSRKTARMKFDGRAQVSRHTSRMIVSVDPVPPVPVRCISVDSPSHLYLASTAGIPTHNTTDLAGIQLAALYTQAPPMGRLYVGASDEEQAQELIDAALGLIERTPELAGSFRTGELEITCTTNGASVRALAADASAMGKRAWMITLDEVANWPETRKARRFWGVLTSGNRKIQECRTVVITNAGDPVHWAWQRRETARTSPHWRFVSIAGPLPWLTGVDLQVLRENAETASEYERLHLNKWTTSEDRLASREDLAACTTLPGPLPPQPGVTYVASLDIGIVNDRTVLAVMHTEETAAGRRVVLDAIDRWQGSRTAPVDLGAVRDTLIARATDYRASAIVDPHQAVLIGQEARAAGVDLSEFPFTAASVGRLALSLHQAIRNHRIALPPDEDLLDELASVRLRKNSLGIYRLDHDSGQHDDQAVTLALGVHALLDGDPLPSFPILDAVDVEPGAVNLFGHEVYQQVGTWARRPDPEAPEWDLDADAEASPKPGSVQVSPFV